MTTIKETAEAYEPQQTKNIVELEAVSVQQDIKRETRKNKQNEEYTISFVVVNGEEYRVPNSVIEQLQAILKEKPDMKTFKVTRKGEGLNTSYTVIQLE